jgi:hypothetical protein
MKTFRIEQGTLVVIAQQADLAGDEQLDAFSRIRTIADNVAQADNIGDLLGIEVG